jgi:WD40 repeat protein/serine/threonine protein kinase
MPSSDSSRDALLEQLAQEFVERHRRGEQPAISHYVDRHPDLAADIRQLFPAMIQVEKLKPAAGDLTGAFVAVTVPAAAHSERLGDYRILREIGHGGMGVVYEAEQEPLGRHVALKVLPRQALLKATYLERFRREAKAAAKLHHTNIVPVFGVGEHGGTHYYAMQFIRGEGLDKVLCDLRRLRAVPGELRAAAMPSEASVAHSLLNGGFTPPAAPPEAEPFAPSAPSPATTGTTAEVAHASSTLSAGGSEGHYFYGIARVGLQVADALAYAHRQGILHRDIKPSNLLLDPEGTVWVTDFGLAKAEGADELTQTGDIVGTVRFMAPERFDGRSLPQSDVYSLGVTLYELLTLRPAFDDTNKARLVEKVLHEAPLPPRKVDPRIPRDLETVVLKCLAKEPAERYKDADALAEDVRRFLSDRPILARRSSLAERAWRWCRRNPAVATLTILVVTMLAAVAAGSTVAAVSIAADRQALAKARDEADRNAAGIERARKQEMVQRIRAEDIADESRQRLARLCLANGERLREDGDGLGALVWFAEALKGDAADRPREDTHRVRLATALRQSPRLLQFWTFEQPVYHAEFSPDGRYVVATSGSLHFVSPAQGEARVYDTVTGKEVFPTLQHPLPVYHASFSRDGRRLVTGCGGHVPVGPRRMRDSGEARVWDARTGKPLTKALEHETWVRRAVFSPDDRQLITLFGAYNNFNGAQVWDLATEKPAGPAVKLNQAYHLSLDPDVRRLAVGSWMDARVLDLFTGQALTPLMKHGLKEIAKGARRGMVNHVAFSQDGKRLVTASGDDTARVWDAVTGQPVTPPLKHNDKVNHAEFSPDGKWVITASDDETARVWDAATGDPVTRLIKHNGHVIYAAFSPDGRRVVTVSGDPPVRPSDTRCYQVVRVWEAGSGNPLSPVFRHGAQVTRAVFSPDSRRLVTAGMDGVVRLWDLAGMEPANLPFGPDGWVSHAAISPDGRHLLTKAGDGTANVWALGGGKPDPLALKLSGYVHYLAFSRNGRRVLTANGGDPYGPFKPGEEKANFADDRQAQVWDCQTGKPVGTPLRHAQHVSHAAFSPDGSRVVTASEDKTARVWNAETGEPVTRPLPHGDRVTCAAFSPDESRVVTCSWDGTARVWDAATGEPAGPVLQAGRSPNHASFSPDGLHILTDGYDRTARLWDATAGNLLGAPLKHGANLTDVFFDERSCRIVVMMDQEARVWDVTRGEPATPLLKHRARVNTAVFSPDGRHVVTASEDGTARVWDAATGEPITPPLPHGTARQGYAYSARNRSDVPRAGFSPDGRRLITVGWSAAQNWDLRPDERPAEDLIRLAVLLSGHQVDNSGGYVPVPKDFLKDVWKQLRAKYPGEFTNSHAEPIAGQLKGRDFSLARLLDTRARPVPAREEAPPSAEPERDCRLKKGGHAPGNTEGVNEVLKEYRVYREALLSFPDRLPGF